MADADLSPLPLHANLGHTGSEDQVVQFPQRDVVLVEVREECHQIRPLRRQDFLHERRHELREISPQDSHLNPLGKAVVFRNSERPDGFEIVPVGKLDHAPHLKFSVAARRLLAS